jgi:hypothetical protein
MRVCSEQDRWRLHTLYTRALLERPPVRSVAHGVAGREESAENLARKDVGRLLAALQRNGYALRLERVQSGLFDEADEAEEEVRCDAP